MNNKDRLINILQSCDLSANTDTIADYLFNNGVYLLPAKVGDKYYRVMRFCTENGYLPEPEKHEISDCECCDTVLCNCTLRIVEFTFTSNKQVYDHKDCIGSFIFLTYEDAEKALKRKLKDHRTPIEPERL